MKKSATPKFTEEMLLRNAKDEARELQKRAKNAKELIQRAEQRARDIEQVVAEKQATLDVAKADEQVHSTPTAPVSESSRSRYDHDSEIQSLEEDGKTVTQVNWTLGKNRVFAKRDNSLAKELDSAVGDVPSHVRLSWQVRAPQKASQNQNIVLFNLAHEKQNPGSKRPAIRLLGGFRDDAESFAHYSKKRRAKMEVNFWRREIGEWFLLARDQTASMEYKKEKVERILLRYLTLRGRDHEDFDMNARSPEAAKIPEPDKEEAIKELSRKNAPSNPPSAPEGFDGVAKPYQQGWKVINQEVAVICYLNDYVDIESPEPAMCVLGFFRSKEDADSWIDKSAKHLIVDFDMWVVDPYVWLFPEDINYDDVDEEHYRDKQLQETMDYRKKNKAQTEEMLSLVETQTEFHD